MGPKTLALFAVVVAAGREGVWANDRAVTDVVPGHGAVQRKVNRVGLGLLGKLQQRGLVQRRYDGQALGPWVATSEGRAWLNA